MPLRAYAAVAVLFALVALGGATGCQSLIYSFGIAEKPPPTTNAAYFSERMNLLLGDLRTNQSKGVRKAAVLDFVNTDGRVSDLGSYMTIKFREQALASKSFKVVPGGQVGEALARLKIIPGQELTRDQIQALGIELDVDTVVTGVVADLQKGSDVDLSVKAVSTQGGELVSAASVPIYRSKQVQTLIQQFP